MTRSIVIPFVSVWSLMPPRMAEASSTPNHVFASPTTTTAAAIPGIAGVGQVTLALALVLVAIFVAAWLIRRLRNISAVSGSTLNVIAEVRLGAKERAVLLRVGSNQLLLGVAPGRISTLHILAESVSTDATPADPTQRPSFQSLLLKSLGRK